jgi:hypothetical protein
VSHLLQRGCNESRDAFPWRLPDHAQPTGKIQRGLHRFIRRESCLDLLERMIQREVMPHHARAYSAETQHVATLFQQAGLISDRSRPSVAMPPPVEHLAAGESLFQV